MFFFICMLINYKVLIYQFINLNNTYNWSDLFTFLYIIDQIFCSPQVDRPNKAWYLQKASIDNAFVILSTSIFKLQIYLILSFWSLINFLIQWCCTLICLVWCWLFAFFVRVILILLFFYNLISGIISYFSSLINCRIYTSILAIYPNVIYSASMLEVNTVLYFLLLQEITAPLRKK